MCEGIGSWTALVRAGMPASAARVDALDEARAAQIKECGAGGRTYGHEIGDGFSEAESVYYHYQRVYLARWLAGMPKFLENALVGGGRCHQHSRFGSGEYVSGYWPEETWKEDWP